VDRICPMLSITYGQKKHVGDFGASPNDEV
jgi:hypothetical protein